MIGQLLAQRRVAVMDDFTVGRSVAAAALELGDAAPSAKITTHACRQHDQGKGCTQEEDCDKGGDRNPTHHIVLERA
jgi:hypothetical protein